MVRVTDFEKFTHSVSPKVIVQLRLSLRCQTPFADHVPGYRRPGFPQASACPRQILEPRIERVDGEPVSVTGITIRTGRKVTRCALAVECHASPRRQLVLRDRRG